MDIKKQKDDLDDPSVKDGAIVRLYSFPKCNGTIITGNRIGLIRMAVESLATALKPEEKELVTDEVIDQVEYLQGDNRRPFWFRRDESITVEEYPGPEIEEPTTAQKIIEKLWYLVPLSLISIFGIGIYTIVTWITQD